MSWVHSWHNAAVAKFSGVNATRVCLESDPFPQPGLGAFKGTLGDPAAKKSRSDKLDSKPRRIGGLGGVQRAIAVLGATVTVALPLLGKQAVKLAAKSVPSRGGGAGRG